MKYFAAFLGFMLLCTVVSRGIYAYQMPRIEVGRAAVKTISHTVFARGEVQAAKKKQVMVQDGIRISEICVKAGEKVEEGTLLIRLDTSDLKDLLEDIHGRISVEKERIAAIERSGAADKENHKSDLDRAREDMVKAETMQNEAVLKAQGEYDEAVKKPLFYPLWESYWEQVKKKDNEYWILKDASEKVAATDKDRSAFEVYEQKLKQSAETAWAEGKKALEDDVAVKKKALDAAIAERSEAILQAKRNLEDAEKEAPVDKSGKIEEENTLKKLQKQQAKYQKLLQNQGEISSEFTGYVETIFVAAGGRTPDGAAMSISDSAGGWEFKAALTDEQADSLKAGDTVTCKFQDGKLIKEDCMVTAIGRTEEGSFEATVEVKEDSLSLGESGTLEVTGGQAQYSCCVPLSALYSDNNKDYILLIRETDTILGTELSVVKREVSVQDKNEGFAALEDGLLGEEDKFVVYSSKAVMPGDKVRLLEEEDGKE